MKRRSVLGTVALLLSAGCVDRWPQPTGPRGPPEAPEGQPRDPETVRIDEWDYGETDAGRLHVFGTVRNDGDTTAEATVEVNVRAGEDRYQRTEQVEIPANDVAEFDIEFDVEYETFRSDGSIRVTVQ